MLLHGQHQVLGPVIGKFQGRGFNHDPDHWFGAGRADEDAALIPHRGFGLGDRLLQGVALFPVEAALPIFNPDILENLGIGLKAVGDQFRQGGACLPNQG